MNLVQNARYAARLDILTQELRDSIMRSEEAQRIAVGQGESAAGTFTTRTDEPAASLVGDTLSYAAGRRRQGGLGGRLLASVSAGFGLGSAALAAACVGSVVLRPVSEGQAWNRVIPETNQMVVALVPALLIYAGWLCGRWLADGRRAYVWSRILMSLGLMLAALAAAVVCDAIIRGRPDLVQAALLLAGAAWALRLWRPTSDSAGTV